jgi:hypothetical protein
MFFVMELGQSFQKSLLYREICSSSPTPPDIDVKAGQLNLIADLAAAVTFATKKVRRVTI